MLSRISKFPRARATVLGLGAGVLATLAFSSSAFAAAGTPIAGSNCQPSGKISGRGSTLQLWLQVDLAGSYSNDVCGGGVGADPASPTGTLQVATDPTDPANPVANGIANTTQASNWMTAYNDALDVAASGTGSTQGKVAISCRTDAFSGTDIPYAKQDWTEFDGASGAEATYLGKSCTNTSGGNTVTPPFQPGPFPSSDSAGNVMSFPIGLSAAAFPINLTAAECGGTAPSGLQLSLQDISDIMGGVETNWQNLDTNHNVTINGSSVAVNDAGENPSLAACNVPIVRVVRNDTSGTTQATLNFLSDANGGSTQGTTPNTCALTGTGSNGSQNTTNWYEEDQDVIGTSTAPGNNNGWPGENGTGGAPPAGCTQVLNSGSSGGPSLLTLLESTAGGIGYADISDVLHDPNSGGLIVPALENSTSPTLPANGGSSGNGFGSGMTTAQPGTNGGATGGSNCSTTLGLPGSNLGDMGLDSGGDWALDNGASLPNPQDDVAFKNQGGAYPACTLTWDFVFSKEDGNLAAHSTGSQAFTGTGDTVFNVSAALPAGTPSSGTFTALNTLGSLQTFTYTGFTTVAPFQFTGVSGGLGTIRTNSIVTIANGTGGPEGTLTANQRRTLYSYFTYVFSDAAQGTFSAAGYASLPESWISALRGAFQAEF